MADSGQTSSLPGAGEPNASTRRLLICLAVVFTVATVVRLGWTGYRWSNSGGGADLRFFDEQDYWSGAVGLAEGEGLTDADGRRATRMPLYPWFLSLFAPNASGAWVARAVQAILGALVAPLISVLAWRLAGPRAGWLAGLMAAADPFAVYFSALLLTEVLSATVLVAFWVVSWPLAHPDGRWRTWRWPAGGALFLLLVYIHPAAFGLLFVWGVFAAVAARREVGNFAGLTVMALILAAGLTPWVWRNHRLLGEPVLLTTRLGISLYDGQGPQADGSSNLGFTRYMEAYRLGECEWNHWFRDEALRTMWSNPGRVWRLALTKARRMWDPFPHADEAQSRGVQVVSAGWSLLVFTLAVPALWYWRGRAWAVLLLLLPALYSTCVHMIFVGSIRYRLPFMPLIELLSAVGACRLIGLLRPSWLPSLPAEAPLMRDHEPVTWLDRRLAASRYGRHPVPLWRRRLAMAGLLALGLGYYAYQYFTSDERIRQQAVNFLTRFTGGEVRIGRAQFGLFSGISLRDVTIAMPGHIDFDPTAMTFGDRQVFSAVNLQLQHSPLSLLTGRLRVTELLADEPTVSLVRNPGHPVYAYNWQTLFPPQPKKTGGGRMRLPLIRIRNAHVRIIEIVSGRRKAEPNIDLSALAIPDAHRQETYTVAWRKSGELPEQGRLYYNLKAGSYSGKLPTLPMTTIKATLPQRYKEWLETLEIAGQIRPEQIHYDARHGSRASIRLEGIRLSVPMGTEERPTTQAAKRFVRLSGASGHIELTPTQSTARLRGKLNDAACEVVATVTNYAGPLEEVGFDIELKADNIRLPEAKDPAGARFIQQIEKVRNFFKDFDPHGRTDVDFHLIKSPGRDMGVLLRGTMTSRGCDASYRMFPYRLKNVTGTVRFAEDGIWLEDLAGQRGSGLVVVSGHVDGPNWYTGFDLHIVGEGVPFDPELYRAVPEKFRRVWRRFDPVGLANADVRLRRGPGSAEGGVGTRSTQIRADLVETLARFVDFPYRLRHATGRLLIDDDRIEIRGLTGTHGSASVRLDGAARYGEESERELELRLEAKELPIDDDLAAALPTEGRRTYRELQPTGHADLLGRVFLPRGGDHVSYSIGAGVRGATICYETFPYRLEGVEGRLRFRPDVIELDDVRARRSSTNVRAGGRIERRDDDSLTDLTVECDPLDLSQDLYKALPDSLRSVWDTLSPSGQVRLKTHIRSAGSGGKQVSTHDTAIELLGNQVRYKALPLPLSDVRGNVRMTDEVVDLREVTGRHGGGRVTLSGRIPLVGLERTGRMRLRVAGLPFSEALREALPWRIRKVWNDIEPTGTFDLDLEELSYQSAADKPTAWTYQGRATVHGAAMSLGFQATEMEGSIEGRGTVFSDGSEMTIDAGIDLKRAAVNQRVLTEVTGRMRRASGSDVLLLDDLAGRTYGGQASGFGRVTFESEGTRYALSMIVRDMQLGPFLNSTRAKDSPPTKAQGIVDGRLYLGGVSGRVDSRQGTGEVHVREAQMYKLPFVLAMLSAINITIPEENAFHDAWASFYLQGRRLTFDTIELKGRSLSMLGGGSMDTETENLDLTFITGSPHDLPRIPLLIDLAQGASRELMEISITGPLGEPKMEGKSLYTLRSALRALFGGEQASTPRR
ncbi:MAG: hypothetical protein JXQ73_11355 [Phycisphaerae bacterium]|nr:hypothetical protein [Phycisphaerae bacterium]